MRGGEAGGKGWLGKLTRNKAAALEALKDDKAQGVNRTRYLAPMSQHEVIRTRAITGCDAISDCQYDTYRGPYWQSLDAIVWA